MFSNNYKAIFELLGNNEKSIKPLSDVEEEIKKELVSERKKEYATNLMNNQELSWVEIENILNPLTPLIANNPFEEGQDLFLYLLHNTLYHFHHFL